MAGWKPSLPSFLVALPKDLISTPEGAELDYLVISCCDSAHPEWDSYNWKGMAVKAENTYQGRYFQICTVDSNGTIWNAASSVSDSGQLTNPCNTESLSVADNIFLNKLRNLAVNILLATQFSSSLFSDVAKFETEITKGFVKQVDPLSNNSRYPRWLGKNYQPKSISNSNCGTHSSPCIHWRRGHWRVLESAEDKRWKQTK